MCYSAKILADFRIYQRYGGTLDMRAFAKLAGWAAEAGTWMSAVPKSMRNAFLASAIPEDEEARKAALEAYRAAALAQERLIAEQTERLTRAESVLAGPKPTKKAATDKRVATNKIAEARRKLSEVNDFAIQDGFDRIWPGYYAPVLIRDPATGERMVVPMRYRCRLPGWTAADEREKPGTYMARRNSLSTVWRKLWGFNHAVVVASRFYEAVRLHDLQHRSLAPGEREISIELEFRPEPAQDMFLACLWRYSEPTDNEPGFYSFAAISRPPPPEIRAAGHDRCIIAIRPEHLDAWLNPDPKHLADQEAILDDPIDAYYQHQLSERGKGPAD
ncbi:SOS response-associated peptidase family protein [Luteibacter yeojuensis]|uniref:DUF159 family protein n=1 Tax=Luteibacter yeojuensis TaxID=345309 RepID=A0A7X5QXP9_9GAMM|nr:SOS response-associated peptidase family protein [Luteibacter yeojuensis]NID17247.1 DUF159 family protein [Luteibacter yeojuensis]